MRFPQREVYENKSKFCEEIYMVHLVLLPVIVCHVSLSSAFRTLALSITIQILSAVCNQLKTFIWNNGQLILSLNWRK